MQAIFNYAFFRSPRRDGSSGPSRFVLDTEKLIASRLNFAPRYAADSSQALEDKHCIIVSVQPTPARLNNNVDHRRVTISIRDTGFFDGDVMRKSDVVMQPSFLPFTVQETKRLFAPGTPLFTIHALPSRANPSAIALAKELYFRRLPKEKVKQLSKPVTTVLCGDLTYFNEDPNHMIKQIANIVDYRGDRTILITSSNTDPLHAIALRHALSHYLEESHLWHQHLGRNAFYMAALGIAAQNSHGEILVTEDSRSGMSYAAATKSNMRIVRAFITKPDLIGREARISRSMGVSFERNGILVNDDDINARKSYQGDTGVDAAIDGAIKIMRRKLAGLAR